MLGSVPSSREDARGPHPRGMETVNEKKGPSLVSLGVRNAHAGHLFKWCAASHRWWDDGPESYFGVEKEHQKEEEEL